MHIRESSAYCEMAHIHDASSIHRRIPFRSRSTPRAQELNADDRPDDHQSTVSNAIPPVKVTPFVPSAQAIPFVPSTQVVPLDSSRSLLCCTDSDNYIPKQRIFAPSRPWIEAGPNIWAFLMPILNNPPPEQDLVSNLLTSCAYVLQILVRNEPNLANSARYITYGADGTVMDSYFETGCLSSQERYKVFQHFRELLLQASCRCRIHGYFYTFSLYRKPVNQDLICCLTCLRHLTSIHTHGTRPEITWISSFYRWMQSVELGRPFLIPRDRCSKMFQVFRISTHGRLVESARLILFDRVSGIVELGNAGGPPAPDANRVRLLGDNTQMVEIFCTDHGYIYYFRAFELLDHDYFNPWRGLGTMQSGFFGLEKPVAQYVSGYGDQGCETGGVPTNNSSSSGATAWWT